jgi:hypothetical protein
MMTPDVDRAILDLMESFKTLGSQRPTFAAAAHALTAAILAYGDARAAAERERAAIRAEAFAGERARQIAAAIRDLS